ncbi:hypothetical protein [Riemerella anatipestifer]|uniref:hypothetical protein n=1 Tax=Riemerella anatipestifer TaxID=34085 RepID=UPI001374A395|nr:hypothetical protein [Riemerella anatipestifer]
MYGREYLTSNPDGVKNLITKGVKKYPLFEQRCWQGAMERVLGILAFSNEV